MNKQNKALLKNGNLVQVYWLDIMGFTNECLKLAKPAPCYSIGHVRRISRESGLEYMILSSAEYEHNDMESIGDCTAIPLGCIYKVELIKGVSK